MERLGSELKAVRHTKNTEAAAPDPSRCEKSPRAAVSPSVAAAVSPSVAVAGAPSVAAAVPPIASAKSPPPAVSSVPAQTGRLDSLIVSEYPPLFEEFRMKRWTVLWRGSRDGFTAEEFHRRCDGHANTLTLILDTNGNVFGGFTPVEWDSSGKWKGDDSLRSFLFTLRSPHGVPPRKFALKKDKKEKAIWCYSRCCAAFGDDDIGVCDNCNTNSDRYTAIGTRYGSDTTYENDTQFEKCFSGAEEFTVNETEVFKIKD
jgi:hypothetical protein